MDVMDELVVQEYFRLSKRISELKRHFNEMRWEFYQQSMTTHLEYSSLVLFRAVFGRIKRLLTFMTAWP